MSYLESLLQWPISQVQYTVTSTVALNASAGKTAFDVKSTASTLSIVHKISKVPFTYKHNSGFEFSKTTLTLEGTHSAESMFDALEQELKTKKALNWYLPLNGKKTPLFFPNNYKVIPFPTGNNVLIWLDTKSNTWSYKLGNGILDTPQGPGIQYHVLSPTNPFPSALPPLFALEIISHHLSNKGGAEAFITYHHWFCNWYKATFGKDKPTCSTNHAGQFFENLFGALTGTPWVEAAVKTKDYDPTYENNFKQILAKINSLPKPTSKLTKG